MNAWMTFPHTPFRIRFYAAVAFLGVATATVARADDCATPVAGSDGVYVRSGPGTQNSKLGVLESGQTIPVKGEVPNWRKVDFIGQAAFVSKRWTKLVSCGLPIPPPTSKYELHAIDVGTGLSILVRGPDFTLLYDAGSNDDMARDSGNRVVSYLATVTPSITKIDHVILSHPHRDHVELLPDVLKKYTVGSVWNSGATTDICGYRHFLQQIAAHGSIVYHTASQGAGAEPISLLQELCYKKTEPAQNITLQHGSQIQQHQVVSLGAAATMTFLYANGETQSNLNENSLVVRLDLSGYRILFMGDAQGGERASPSTPPSSSYIEGALLDCCSADLKADVMIVGHHGSKTSSRVALLDAVQPKYFIVSSGPAKYGHVTLPDQEIIDELSQRGAVLRTDLDDVACKTSDAKVGPDSDGKAGGCDNVLITLPVGGKISAEYRRLAD